MDVLKEKIPKQVFQRLESAEVSTLDFFLVKSPEEICDKIKLSYNDTKTLITIVSEIILNRSFITVNELSKQQNTWSVLSLGCPVLNKAINGIPLRGITEFFGESGVGKTQMGLHLALQVQKSEEDGGLNAGALYICTEDAFPSKRLNQMSSFLAPLVRNNKVQKYSDEIFIERVHDLEELKYCITIKAPVLLSRIKVRLIVIDSIAAVFRYDQETSDYITRSEDLRLLATKLTSLAAHYNLAVVCLNQVTSDPVTGIKPCLGLSWSNLVRKRVKLSSSNTTVTVDNQAVRLRQIKVVFAPDTPPNCWSFVVTNRGISAYS